MKQILYILEHKQNGHKYLKIAINFIVHNIRHIALFKLLFITSVVFDVEITRKFTFESEGLVDIQEY